MCVCVCVCVSVIARDLLYVYGIRNCPKSVMCQLYSSSVLYQAKRGSILWIWSHEYCPLSHSS